MSATDTPKQGKRLSPKSVIVGLAGALVVVFILQNRQETTLTFINRDREFPLWIVLAVTAIVGGVVGQLIERYLRKEHKE